MLHGITYSVIWFVAVVSTSDGQFVQGYATWVKPIEAVLEVTQDKLIVKHVGYYPQVKCLIQCMHNSWCKSINFGTSEKYSGTVCELLHENVCDQPERYLTPKSGHRHYIVSATPQHEQLEVINGANCTGMGKCYVRCHSRSPAITKPAESITDPGSQATNKSMISTLPQDSRMNILDAKHTDSIIADDTMGTTEYQKTFHMVTTIHTFNDASEICLKRNCWLPMPQNMDELLKVKNELVQNKVTGNFFLGFTRKAGEYEYKSYKATLAMKTPQGEHINADLMSYLQTNPSIQAGKDECLLIVVSTLDIEAKPWLKHSESCFDNPRRFICEC